MRVKVVDKTGIRAASGADAREILQSRDLIEFACDAEELFDEVPCSEPARVRKRRLYDWREEEKKNDPER